MKIDYNGIIREATEEEVKWLEAMQTPYQEESLNEEESKA